MVHVALRVLVVLGYLLGRADEARLHREVCAGRMTREQAQREMVATWGLH